MNNRVILIAGLAVLLVAVSFITFNYDSETLQPSAQIDKSLTITVYVSGQVKNISVVTLEDTGNLRLVDAVNAVGGMTEYADSELINLADPLTDGQHVHIPAKDVTFQEIIVADSEKTVADIININTADSKELEKIRGVGPAIAGRIIEYRTNNGAFKSIDEIKKVRGIGDKIFAKMKDSITVD